MVATGRSTRSKRVLAVLVLFAPLAPVEGGVAADPVVGAVDDFQGAHDWQGHSETLPCGLCLPPLSLCLCPPGGEAQGVSTQLGGPDGLLDVYLQVNELPSFGVETWNRAADRTGSYLAAGVGAIDIDLNNVGPGVAEVRVGLESAGTRWVTSDDAALVLPAESGWQAWAFELSGAEMTRVAGSGSLVEVLDDVEEIRILHAFAAQWSGDRGATLGIDNVRLPEPADPWPLVCGAALLALLAARRGGCRPERAGY